MHYSIAIENKNNVYIGHFPDIEGLIVKGNNMADTISNARENIINHLNAIAESGGTIPEASSINDHLMKPEFAGFNWAIINLNINRIVDEDIEVTLSLPKQLHQNLNNLCQKSNEVNINSYIIKLLKEHISTQS